MVPAPATSSAGRLPTPQPPAAALQGEAQGLRCSPRARAFGASRPPARCLGVALDPGAAAAFSGGVPEHRPARPCTRPSCVWPGRGEVCEEPAASHAWFHALRSHLPCDFWELGEIGSHGLPSFQQPEVSGRALCGPGSRVPSSPRVTCVDTLCPTGTCSWMGTAATRSTSHTSPPCRFSRKASRLEVNAACPPPPGGLAPASVTPGVTQWHCGWGSDLLAGSPSCPRVLCCVGWRLLSGSRNPPAWGGLSVYSDEGTCPTHAPT